MAEKLSPHVEALEKAICALFCARVVTALSHSQELLRNERYGEKRVFSDGAQKSAQVRADLVRLCSHTNAGMSGERTSAQNPIGLCACAPLRGEVLA